MEAIRKMDKNYLTSLDSIIMIKMMGSPMTKATKEHKNSENTSYVQ
jgi:hypothetical protein